MKHPCGLFEKSEFFLLAVELSRVPLGTVYFIWRRREPCSGEVIGASVLCKRSVRRSSAFETAFRAKIVLALEAT